VEVCKNRMDPRDVFLVEHTHVLDDGEESVKTIGIYSTREKAEQAIERLRLRPGFCDAPDGFVIDLYWVDQDGWEGGYVTLTGSQETRRS
jgi:hypothetical protein